MPVWITEAGYDISTMPSSTVTDTTPDFPQTPELYAGYNFNLPRGQNIGNAGGLKAGTTATYTLPIDIDEDTIYLSGKWISNEQSLEAAEDNAKIVLNYRSTAVNIVIETADGSQNVQVTLDGKAVTDAFDGRDVQLKDGTSVLTVVEPRLYNAIFGEYGRHTVEFTVPKGFSFYAFTFG